MSSACVWLLRPVAVRRARGRSVREDREGDDETIVRAGGWRRGATSVVLGAPLAGLHRPSPRQTAAAASMSSGTKAPPDASASAAPPPPAADGGGLKGMIASLPTVVDALVDAVCSRRSLPQALETARLERSQREKWQRKEGDGHGVPGARRVVAIGDLHGDIEKTRQAFRVGGLVDEKDAWVGGDTVAVQVGDQLDRGSNELQILYWLRRLQSEAAAAGGALHVVNGNHEVMAVAGDFRYATPGSFDEFKRAQSAFRFGDFLRARLGLGAGAGAAGPPGAGAYPAGMREEERPRFDELRPGGRVTRRFLADNATVLQVGSTVFAHGGVTPPHVAYGVDRINEEARRWMRGEADGQVPQFYRGRDSVVWTRDYSNTNKSRCDCAKLETALAGMRAKRMVVGHTIQTEGINDACGGRVFRVDVGLSRGCGDGEPEVLEILDDTVVRVLRRGAEPIVLSDGVCEIEKKEDCCKPAAAGRAGAGARASRRAQQRHPHAAAGGGRFV